MTRQVRDQVLQCRDFAGDIRKEQVADLPVLRPVKPEVVGTQDAGIGVRRGGLLDDLAEKGRVI